MAIAAEIKRRYSVGSILVRLIYIIIAVFIEERIAALIGMFMNQPAIQLLQWIEFPSGDMVLHRPWTLLTYMFSHYDLFHILFNMLWLYWLGRIFLEYFTPKQLGALYVLGGWLARMRFSEAYAVRPYFVAKMGDLLGASATG